MQFAHLRPNLLVPVVCERDEVWFREQRAGIGLDHRLCLLKEINLPEMPHTCGGTEHRGWTEELIGRCVDESFPKHRSASQDSPW